VPLPKILIADDHRETRELIESLLTSDFDVVAAVSDGQLAVEAVAALRPDLVVLDITMPVLGGFAAAARIRNLAQVPRIVFLTAHEDPALAEAAVSLGASAFLLKRKMLGELVPAIRRALGMPSKSIVRSDARSEPHSTPEAGHVHAVFFYEDPQALSSTVGRFIAEGLHADQPGLVIATASHKAGILEHLAGAACNPEKRMEEGDLVVLDADELLSLLLVGGMPGVGSLESAMTQIMNSLSDRGHQRGVRVYGEMVDLLWKRKKEDAALSLEIQWDRFVRPRRFPLLCSYSKESLGERGHKTISDHHSHVVSETNPILPC
jgi:CheY-like chemotaxis protein